MSKTSRSCEVLLVFALLRAASALAKRRRNTRVGCELAAKFAVVPRAPPRHKHVPTALCYVLKNTCIVLYCTAVLYSTCGPFLPAQLQRKRALQVWACVCLVQAVSQVCLSK